MRKKSCLRAGLLAGLFMALNVFSVARGQQPSDSLYQLLAPLPDVLLSGEGKVISTSEGWEAIRREEVLNLFRSHVYGEVPRADYSIAFRVVFQDNHALGGKAVMKEVEVSVRKGTEALEFIMLVFLPAHSNGPVPLFLGLNFNGNHTIHPSPEISITKSWVQNNARLGISDNSAKESSRGSSASRWPVDLILERGYGVASIYCGDIDPDFDDGFVNGIQGLLMEEDGERKSDSWGTIAGWAWGLSRVMDYFETDPAIDHGRVAVIGHSRLGKTSLWAGAQDERFAMVVSNNSGCGGAALSRRPFGERVSAINRVFPHWFAPKFHDYNDNEAACPVDQHMLLALVAPRPLYVASAEEDEWADPRGEYLSLLLSGRVYSLYGEKVLTDELSPGLDQARWAGKQGYHIRPGKHDITRYDWEQFLGFADVHMGGVSGKENVNPVSMEWIRKHLRSERPRLILTPGLEAEIKGKLEAGDKLTEMGLQVLEQSAESLLGLEMLAYEKQGRRLLDVSREAVRRITTLAMIYRFTGDQKYLDRLELEMTSVSSFSDWNPDHFLDVAEMACALALGLDWAGEDLSPAVRKLARNALVEKALKPGLAASRRNFWKDVDNNWNLVCNGGLSLAAMEVFEDEPEIASAILHQAVGSIPRALKPYGPDGIYPEGVSYWSYATAYLTVAISGFESALGTDFGFTSHPGVLESATFSMVMAGPTGDYFNYFDSGIEGFQGISHLGLLAWFSMRTGDPVDLDACEQLLEAGLHDPRMIGRSRFFSVQLMNLASMKPDLRAPFEWPENWWGGGPEPIVVARDKENDPDAFFMAAKGGMAGDNHGNMDAGSFVFELGGVRWSVDPGNQDYNKLEQVLGQGLWQSGQDAERWTLLTKNNFGHSTLTVNGEKHLADGRVNLLCSDVRSGSPSFTFDMTPLYGDMMLSATRTFVRENDCLIIRDELRLSEATRNVSWQMLTRASVKVKDGWIVLRQDGKELHLLLESEHPFKASVVELSPPPLAYDKNIAGLKRIELSFDRAALTDSGVILVKLAGAL